MPEWRWEIFMNDNHDESVASGVIANGLRQTPQEILSGMIAASAAAQFFYISAIHVGAWDHDGTQLTNYVLSNGECLRVVLRTHFA